MALKTLLLARLLRMRTRNTVITADSHLVKSLRTRSALSVRPLATSWSRSSAVARQERTATCLILGSLTSSIGTQLEQADLAIATTGPLNIELAISIRGSKPSRKPDTIDHLRPLCHLQICPGAAEICHILSGARKSLERTYNPEISRTNTQSVRENVLILPDLLCDMLSFCPRSSRTVRISL